MSTAQTAPTKQHLQVPGVGEVANAHRQRCRCLLHCAVGVVLPPRVAVHVLVVAALLLIAILLTTGRLAALVL